jgi:3'-phosphoadenosine 5'-phosphosulfate sulfotransferase (PAPS reductase)/FAD synthetase
MTMDPRWRETFVAWAATAEHAARVRGAQAIIARTLREARWPYIAYSGGKDSTVLTALVLKQAPSVLVLHWDYGRAFIPAPVYEEILRNLHALGAKHVRVETSPAYARLGRDARNVLGRDCLGPGGLVTRLREEGYDRVFVALREEESLKRRRRMRAERSHGAIPECWPLRAWTWLDVWAYIVAHRLPYLSLYDTRCALLGYDRARFTTLFDKEFDHLGAVTVDGVLHWRYRNVS